jgi:predicted transposase YbfD/YdcC
MPVAPGRTPRQLCRIERRRTHQQTGVTTPEVSDAVTSLPPTKADAARLLALLRDYWSIENRLHSVRDVTLGEDACQVRCGAAPKVVAVCRNLTIALLRRAGIANVAQTLRTHAARPRAAATLVLGYYLE